MDVYEDKSNEMHLSSSGLDAVSLLDAEDILENTHNLLDELWRLDYPQSRMEHLLDIIANQITRYVQVKWILLFLDIYYVCKYRWIWIILLVWKYW